MRYVFRVEPPRADAPALSIGVVARDARRRRARQRPLRRRAAPARRRGAGARLLQPSAADAEGHRRHPLGGAAAAGSRACACMPRPPARRPRRRPSSEPPTHDRSDPHSPPRVAPRRADPARRSRRRRARRCARWPLAAPAARLLARHRLRLDRGRAARRPAASPAAARCPGRTRSIALHRWRPLARLALRRRHRPGRVVPRRRLVDARPRGAARVRHPQRSRLGRHARRGRGRRAGCCRAAAPRARQHAARQPAEHRLPLRPGQRVLRAVARPGADLFERALRRRRRSRWRQAQAAKLDRIARAAAARRLPAGAQVLEIGCGWGALALDAGAAARRARHRPHAVDASSWRMRRQRVEAERAGRRRSTCACRTTATCDGQFDRIVSIEMLEAVGERYWPAYFETLRERLRPGGVAVVQVITIADAHFEQLPARRRLHPALHLPGRHAAVADGDARSAAERAGLTLAQRGAVRRRATRARWSSGARRFLQAWPRSPRWASTTRSGGCGSTTSATARRAFAPGRVDVGLYSIEHAAA